MTHHYKQLLNLCGGWGANETFGITLPLVSIFFFLSYFCSFLVMPIRKKERESSFWQWSPGKYCHVLLYYILEDPPEVSQPGCTSKSSGEPGKNTDSQTHFLETGNQQAQGEAQEHTSLQALSPKMIRASLVLVFENNC